LGGILVSLSTFSATNVLVEASCGCGVDLDVPPHANTDATWIKASIESASFRQLTSSPRKWTVLGCAYGTAWLIARATLALKITAV